MGPLCYIFLAGIFALRKNDDIVIKRDIKRPLIGYTLELSASYSLIKRSYALLKRGRF